MKEHMEMIGKTVYFMKDGLKFAVEVLDIRSAFGRIDYLVTPKGGSGQKWVSVDSLM